MHCWRTKLQRIFWIVLLCPLFVHADPVSVAQADRQPGLRIALRRESFDPLHPGFATTERARARLSASRYCILQTNQPLNPGLREALRLRGAVPVRTISSQCVIVRADQPVVLRNLPGVRWAGPLMARDRICPKLSQAAQAVPGEIRIIAVTFVDAPVVGQSIAALGGRQIEVAGRYVRAVVPADVVEQIGGIAELEWVESDPDYRAMNDVIRGTVHVNDVHNALGMTGTGQTVAVADTGLDTGVDNPGVNGDLHLDFDNRTTFFNYHGSSPNDFNGHGTHVTGTLAGNGANTFQYRGMAPDASIVFQGLGDDAGTTSIFLPANLSTLFDDAKNNNAWIHNNSWGAGGNYTYSIRSQQVDSYMWSNPNFLVVFAAGNDGSGAGTVTTPGTAKNCITVGASENLRPEKGSLADNPDQLASFSSRGLTADGRIKPDLVVPGTWVLSTLSSLAPGGFGWGSFDAHYAYNGGTSMATPAVSGMAALVRQAYVDSVQITPSAALIKATLINGTENLDDAAGTGPIPNADEGWGRANLKQALIPDAPTVIRFRDNTTGLNQGEQISYPVQVVDTSVPLRFTLVWTDFASTLAASANLVNDINMVVTDPNGNQLNGNDFSAPFDDTTDAINNVEGVFVTNPVLGVYTITLSAPTVPQGPQPFALVFSGGFAEENQFVDTTVAEFNLAASATNIEILDADGAGSGDIRAGTVTTLPATVLAASSEIPPNSLKEKIYDADLTTLWASAGADPPADQFITIELGSAQPFDRVALHPGSMDWSSLTGNGNPTFIPTGFRIETSPDNANWTIQVTKTGFVAPGQKWSTFSFPKTSAQYVRIYATEMTWYDGNQNNVQDPVGEEYHAGVAEVEIYQAGTGSATETSGNFSSSFEGALATDGDTSTLWGSAGANPMVTEHITVDLGGIQDISSVRVNTGDNDFSGVTGNGAETFAPIDFNIRVSDDSVAWTTVKTVIGFVPPKSTWYEFQFTPTTGRYVQIQATNMTFGDGNGDSIPDPGENYHITFGEIQVKDFADQGTAASSNHIDPQFGDPGKATDAGTTTLWASVGVSPLVNESLTLDMGHMNPIYGVRLHSGPLNFSGSTIGGEATFTPIDFEIQTSNNGVAWSTVQTVTGNVQPPNTWRAWRIPNSNTRYVRIVATQLAQWDDNGNGQVDPEDLFFMSLAEVEILRNNNEGELISRVFDTGQTSTWDTITWDATGVEGSGTIVQTRSGNAPDLSAEPWAPVDGSAFLDPNQTNLIASPAGRYIQYRIRLISKSTRTTPTVHSVTIARQ